MDKGASGRDVGAAIVELLRDTPVAGDQHELERFADLSVKEKFKIAVLIKAGEASTVEEAQRSLAERDEAYERALKRRKGFRLVPDPSAED